MSRHASAVATRHAFAGMTRHAARVVLSAVAALVLGLAMASPAGAVARAAPTSGPWRWPVDPPPAVASRFSPPPLPWRPGHRGVDLAVRVGTTVRAAGPGVVMFAGRVGGKPVVVVGHGAVRTTYEPVEASAAVGDRVSAGAPIGRTVAVGGHCGRSPTCLHWGLLRGQTYLDPLRLLVRQSVVLKPPG